ncbi:MAG: hypothetical protein ABJG47_09110 [Ekhidna sp.]
MKLKKVLVDIVPVLVGILLALFINNWQQSRSERNYIENSVASIIKENEENIKELRYAVERQTVFMDTLYKYLDNDEFALVDVLRRAKGVYTPDLKSTTWKFLIQDSKHTLVSYEFINRLAEIEKYEVLVSRYNVKLSDIIFQPAFFDDPRMKDVCAILFGDFGSVQNDLINELESFNAYARKTYAIAADSTTSE